MVPIIRHSEWAVDITNYFIGIPSAYREYMLVRTRRSSRTPETKDDTAIPHSGSLHIGLKMERRAASDGISRLESISDLSLTEKERLDALKQEKDATKERKMESQCELPGYTSHTLPKKHLRNRKDISGLSFFKAFVEKAHADHGIKEPYSLVIRQQFVSVG